MVSKILKTLFTCESLAGPKSKVQQWVVQRFCMDLLGDTYYYSSLLSESSPYMPSLCRYRACIGSSSESLSYGKHWTSSYLWIYIPTLILLCMWLSPSLPPTKLQFLCGVLFLPSLLLYFLCLAQIFLGDIFWLGKDVLDLLKSFIFAYHLSGQNFILWKPCII